MKTLNNNKTILLTCILFLSTICAYAYPPDNAAVLYYKAADYYDATLDVDDKIADMLYDLRKGDIEINDKIREFVNKNRLIINTVLDASEVKNCDWGMDFSQGIKMYMPPLGDLKSLAKLVIADTKIMIQDVHYGPAINNCMSLYKMARHINDEVFISYLVGIGVNYMANDCLIQIMSEMPQNTKNLAELRANLAEIDGIPLSIKPALLGERRAMLTFMTPEQMPGLEPAPSSCDGGNDSDDTIDESIKEKLLSGDEALFEHNREYFKKYWAKVITAFDMPYAEGLANMGAFEQKLEDDSEVAKKPQAILTAILAPATTKMFSHKTRTQTYDNAIKAAIEIYLVKAKTSKLPDVLPENLPIDLFSGKPFEYEITKDGFTLRCRTKEAGKKQLHEYKFKISK